MDNGSTCSSKLLGRKKLFDVIKVNDSSKNPTQITINMKLSEIFNNVKECDKPNEYEYVLRLYYNDKPERVEIYSWDYKDVILDKVHDKKKIKKIYLERREYVRYVTFDAANFSGFKLFISNINSIIENNDFLDQKYNCNNFVKSFPEHWDYFENLVIRQLATRYSFSEYNNITLYFYENMKKLREEKTVENIKKKYKDTMHHDFSLLAKEMRFFYTFRQEKMKFLFGESVNEVAWTDEKALLEVFLTTMAYDKLKDISELDLTQFYIIKENLLVVFSALKDNKNVYKLQLNSNKPAEEGMYFLGRMFMYNKRIKELDLSTNLLNDNAISAFVMGIGEEQLSLQRLNLSSNPNITNEYSGINIGNIIKQCKYLKTLILAKNNMDTSFIHIVKQLKEGHNKLLTNLILSGSRLSSSAMECLGEYLEEKVCSLKYLTLSDNNLNSSVNTFNRFCQGVEKNRSLEELILSNCCVNNANVPAIVKMIKYNRALTKVNLYNNDISNQDSFMSILSAFSEYDATAEFYTTTNDDINNILSDKSCDDTISNDSNNVIRSQIKNFDLSRNKCKLKVNDTVLNTLERIFLEDLDISQNIELGTIEYEYKKKLDEIVKGLKERGKKLIYY
jgi:hypothetical protein